MQVRVAIAEDERRYRTALAGLIGLHPRFKVTTCVGSAEGLVAEAAAAHLAAAACPWDVVLTDVAMPVVDGIEGTRRLKALFPALPIVVLSVFEDPGTILRAICAGANGYLVKDATPQQVLDQLETVLAGGSPLTPTVATALLDVVRDLAGPRAGPQVSLSRRERDVLDGLVKGMSYKQVAADLELSIDTVRSYIRALYEKLQVHSVAEAVSVALRQRLV